MTASLNARSITTASNSPAGRAKAKKPPRAKPLSPPSSNCARNETLSNLKANRHLTHLTPLPNLLNKRHKLLIGVLHLQPLPGSPCWEGRLENVIATAV